MSSRTFRTLVTLAAAAACACAQGRGATTAAGQDARASRGSARPSPAAPAPPNAAAATPTPDAPPFPARERGADAFEPFVRLSGGRRFESREDGRKPARKDLVVGADYPVLLGDGGRAAREFNRRARAIAVGEVTPYLGDGPDPEKAKHPHWKDVEEHLHVSHKVVFASDELVSVFFYVTGYNWGAGHGYHQPLTFNFDLKAGRELKLARLFKPGSGHLRRIAELCAEDLSRQYARQFGRPDPFGKGATLVEGLRPKADNFKSWVVTRDGLVFIFEEYQVVAYADGEPKVLIPFDRLSDIIDPRGPLAALAARE
jgi:hypothetical protein